MVKLGSKVRDTITGFEGIATTRTEYLYGCVHVSISPAVLNKDGQPGKTEFFDEQRVQVIEEAPDAPPVSSASSAKSGGPSLYGYPDDRP